MRFLEHVLGHAIVGDGAVVALVSVLEFKDVVWLRRGPGAGKGHQEIVGLGGLIVAFDHQTLPYPAECGNLADGPQPVIGRLTAQGGKRVIAEGYSDFPELDEPITIQIRVSARRQEYGGVSSGFW